MCGIAGIMTRDGSAPAAEVLDALADAMGHRGPDGRGRHVDGDVGLVQTRLAIIDLPPGPTVTKRSWSPTARFTITSRFAWI